MLITIISRVKAIALEIKTSISNSNNNESNRNSDIHNNSANDDGNKINSDIIRYKAIAVILI